MVAQHSPNNTNSPLLVGNVVEASSFISRQIYAYPPTTNGVLETNLAGYLKLDHQGYYEPYNGTLYQGFSDPLIGTLASAGVQPNAFWPLSGPMDSTPQLTAAYQYFSGQATSGFSTDIRSEYVEEDNDPAQFNTWLSTIRSLIYPDRHCYIHSR